MGRDKIVLKVNHEKLQVLMKSNFLKIGLCLESAEFAVNSMIETSLRGVILTELICILIILMQLSMVE